MVDLINESWRKIWNIWEIRLLVLSSLFLQVVLIILGNRRKYISSSWISAIVWLCYLSADAVATVALGVLSQTSEDDSNSDSSDKNYILMAFWAPVLLLHLGGPDTITAYSLEDNELWLRHLLGLIVQLGVAFYVFLRSWDGSSVNYLSIVMFVTGLTKYGERTVALWSASRNRYRKLMLSCPDPGPNYAKFMDEFKSRKHEGYVVSLGKSMDVSQVADEPPRKATGSKIPHATEMHYADYFLKTFKKLFADLILSFQDKRNSQFFFKEETWKNAFFIVEVELGLIYDIFYTKASLIHSSSGRILRWFTLASTISVFVAFLIVDRGSFSRIEVGITYTLLIGAIILEIYAVMVMLSSDWAMIWLTDSSNMSLFTFRAKISYTIYKVVSFLRRPLHLVPSERRWSGKMKQYNFFVLCINRNEKSKWSKILRLSGVYPSLENHLVPEGLKALIFVKIKAISDDQGNCNKRRDQEILRQNDCLGIDNEDLKFDQSVLIWHVATDLCYHNEDGPQISIAEADKKSWFYDYEFTKENEGEDYYKFIREMSKWLSDYMFYLLIVCPFMLPSGIGQIRFKDTRAEAMEFLKEGGRKPTKNIKDACMKFLAVNTEHQPSEVKGDRSKSVLFDACRLVHSLKNPDNVEKRLWQTIFDAWVDILCHAAAECNWSDHADQLRHGGELLTHVWLLMAHFGLTAQFQISKGYVKAKWQLE